MAKDNQSDKPASFRSDKRNARAEQAAAERADATSDKTEVIHEEAGIETPAKLGWNSDPWPSITSQ